jgi:hypothetical protein
MATRDKNEKAGTSRTILCKKQAAVVAVQVEVTLDEIQNGKLSPFLLFGADKTPNPPADLRSLRFSP